MMSLHYILMVTLLLFIILLEAALIEARREYKLWKADTKKWERDKYFEKVANNIWYETKNMKLIREYELVLKKSDEVILKRTDDTFYIKLSPNIARWGRSEHNITLIYERGNWQCSHCRLPSKPSTDNFLTRQFNFTILNDLAHAIDLIWIDSEGRIDSSPFTSIPSDERVTQLSHLGQRWLLTSDFGDDIEFDLGHGYFRISNRLIKISEITN